MTGPSDKSKTLLHFTADAWEHVCPVLRVRAPAQLAGWAWVQGSNWEDGGLQIYPERIAAADLVVIQRDFPRYAEAYSKVLAEARLRGKPVIYEIDDLLTELPETHPDARYYHSVRPPVLAAMIQADAVTCTTPGLCEYVRRFNPHAWVLPNYLDDRLWTLREQSETGNRAGGPVVIGYLGAHSHRPDLQSVAPVLERLLDRSSGQVILRLWGIQPPEGLDGRPDVEWLDLGMVSYAGFAAYFSRQQADLFIAPLLDNPFNRCKSSLKFLEYSALGVPGVYSRLEPYSRVVNHGQNGFLADTEAEWEQALIQLVEDHDLRERLGQAAQQTVQEGWLLSDHAEEWDQVYRDLARLGTGPETRARVRLAADKFYRWHQDSLDEIRSLNEQIRAKDLEVQAFASRSAAVQQQFEAMRSSGGWKLLEGLYRLRYALAPRGSGREALLRAAFRSARLLQREGPRALAGKWLASVRARSFDPLLGPPPDQAVIPSDLVPGAPVQVPAISLVVEKDPLLPPLDELAVLDWARRQTLAAVEVVVWDRPAGLARLLDRPEIAWEAPGVVALCAALGGRYLCLASADLLRQRRTYLEENLVALESEALVFTLNTLGRSGWATRHLHLGRLPGKRLLPLFRMVVRKEYVKEDYSLDLPARLAGMGGLPAVVGRVITHTTDHPEVGESFALETEFGDLEARTQDRYILARARSSAPWPPAAAPLYTLDSLLPLEPVRSELPAVLMVMPFLAVGGAEQHALKVMDQLKDRICWIVVTFEELDPELGTTADAFRGITPYVYTLPDLMHPGLNLSFVKYLDARFNLHTLYIANGTPWIYTALRDLKQYKPGLRIVNQVYDTVIGWINRYDPALALYLDGHLAVNSRICQAYIAKGARPDDVYLIENGIEPAELDPGQYPPERKVALKEQFGLPAGVKVVTFASRVHAQKRPLDFVELARRFSADPSVVFFMVGDGPLAGEVEAQVARSGLQNFYRRAFYRPISDVLAISDVLVLPSDFEGMPMIIIEAQTMGVPVVVTDVGNNREVVDRTGGGVVIDQIGDVGALFAGVLSMLADRPDPERVRQVALANFSIQVVAQKYMEALLPGVSH